MNIPKPFFKDVPTIGDLNVEEVLEEYHVLLLFTCLDGRGNRYLCTCYDIRQHQDWLVVPVTPDTLMGLLRDELTIRQALAEVNKNAIAISLDYETRKETSRIMAPDSAELKDLLRALKALDEPMDTASMDAGQRRKLDGYVERLRKEG